MKKCTILTGSSVSVSVSPAHITPGVVLIGLSRTRGVLVDATEIFDFVDLGTACRAAYVGGGVDHSDVIPIILSIRVPMVEGLLWRIVLGIRRRRNYERVKEKRRRGRFAR
jgi:hypothetical protein